MIGANVGLTLSNSLDNLLGFIQEFNFYDFDAAQGPHALDSIELLRWQGINFKRNCAIGINLAWFVELVMLSGPVCNGAMSWVTFHSTYDLV
ncbi:hypothetical protein NL676_018115 [Syzygium grande]|nr:hypothetical protein NL676_018115 [Syzygium grande]